MSSTNANVNANVNPVYGDVIKVELSEFLHQSDALGGIEPFRISSEFLRIWLSMESAMELLGLQWEKLFSVSFWKQRMIRMFLSS